MSKVITKAIMRMKNTATGKDKKDNANNDEAQKSIDTVKDGKIDIIWHLCDVNWHLVLYHLMHECQVIHVSLIQMKK